MKYIKGTLAKENKALPWYEQSTDYLLRNHIFYESGKEQIIILWLDDITGLLTYDNVPLKELTAREASNKVGRIEEEFGGLLADALAYVLYTFLTEGVVIVADFEACVRETIRQQEQRENLQLVKGGL